MLCNQAGGGIFITNTNEQQFLGAFAVYECLWLRLLQPPSTTTVHAGTSSNLMLCCSNSSLPADSNSSVTNTSRAVPVIFQDK